jgi:hypothetical protein
MTALLLALLQDCWVPDNPVVSPLLYLARHQSPDGSWGVRPEPCRCRPLIRLEPPVWIAVDDETEQSFEYLLGRLEDDDGREREEAQRAILRLGTRTVPLLQARLRHPDLEIQDRCRETLHQLYRSNDEVRVLFGGGSPDLRTTSLALLAFIGSGYFPMNRDQWLDPILGRPFLPANVTAGALRWILSRQDDQGAFAADDPVSNVLATLAVVEMYGWTEMPTLMEPAISAIASVLATRSTDRLFLIWKGVLLATVQAFEVQPVDLAELREWGHLLARDESLPGRFGALLLLRLGKTRDSFMPEMPGLALDTLSPEEIWVATTAAIKIRGFRTKEWRALQDKFIADRRKGQKLTCENGSEAWPVPVAGDRLRTAAFQALLTHRFYRYTCSLLSDPPSQPD